MNALIFYKSSTGLIFYCAATLALLTQLLTIKNTPMIINIGNSRILRWHRWAGYAALGGLMLNRMIFPFNGEQPAFPFALQNLTHSLLCMLCAVAFLKTCWMTKRQAQRSFKRVSARGFTIFILGMSFFTITCALVVWRWTNPSISWDKNLRLIYQVATLGHAGLAFSLIILGRMALLNSRRLLQSITLESTGRQAGTKTNTIEPYQF